MHANVPTPCWWVGQEEIFGPVLCIIPSKSEEEAIAIANDTIYGLNNAVASASVERAMAVAMRLRSGQVQINTPLGGAGPMVPFGGYKQSGDGREWGKYVFGPLLFIFAIQRRAVLKVPRGKDSTG